MIRIQYLELYHEEQHNELSITCVCVDRSEKLFPFPSIALPMRECSKAQKKIEYRTLFPFFFIIFGKDIFLSLVYRLKWFIGMSRRNFFLSPCDGSSSSLSLHTSLSSSTWFLRERLLDRNHFFHSSILIHGTIQSYSSRLSPFIISFWKVSNFKVLARLQHARNHI